MPSLLFWKVVASTLTVVFVLVLNTRKPQAVTAPGTLLLKSISDFSIELVPEMSVASMALAFPVVTDNFMKRKVTLLALVRSIALPFGSALLALPVLCVMMPPEFAVDPFPVTVKLPEVLVRMIPFEAPLLETLVSDTARGVVPAARVISTGMPVVVAMSPLVVVIVFVLSVASRAL